MNRMPENYQGHKMTVLRQALKNLNDEKIIVLALLSI